MHHTADGATRGRSSAVEARYRRGRLLAGVIDALVARTLLANPVSTQPKESYDLAVRRILLARLIALASDPQATPTAREAVRAHLVELRRQLDSEADRSPEHRAFLLAAFDDLDAFLRKSGDVR